MEPIVNKTWRAVIAIAIIAFCIATVWWLLLYGAPTNSLHASALSWSYWVIMVAAAALGLDTSMAKLLPQSK